MVSIRGNSETRDDAVQNARSRPAKQPVLQAGGRKKGRQIYHNAPLCALTEVVTAAGGTPQHTGLPSLVHRSIPHTTSLELRGHGYEPHRHPH